ncbi:hypothetical protein P43SY_002054 [Pythium insidiosum]|uniref:AGC/RSK/RSKP90 protein kinase n=1 Tax=Pythium insidiosum TaxID=114742 RepID=A0AAD5LEI7_PYTIN|nr:hypothetical protein P43SY_002054 [Pythium insidiosum]
MKSYVMRSHERTGSLSAQAAVDMDDILVTSPTSLHRRESMRRSSSGYDDRLGPPAEGGRTPGATNAAVPQNLRATTAGVVERAPSRVSRGSFFTRAPPPPPPAHPPQLPGAYNTTPPSSGSGMPRASSNPSLAALNESSDSSNQSPYHGYSLGPTSYAPGASSGSTSAYNQYPGGNTSNRSFMSRRGSTRKSILSVLTREKEAPAPIPEGARAEVTCEGFLTKRGHVFTNWKMRYFVLRGNELEYFSGEDKSKRYGSVVVEKVAPWTGEAHGFMFYTTKQVPYYVYASSEAERAKWLRALKEFYVEPEEVTCEGYLTRRGHLVPSQRFAYYVLNGPWLRHYADQAAYRENQSAIAEVEIRSVSQWDNERFGLMFQTVTGNVFYATAESSSEQQKWLTNLKMASTSTPEPVLCAGYLTKQGHKRKSWKKRYFILRGNTIAYFTDYDMANSAKGKPLAEVIVEDVQRWDGEPFGFMFMTSEQVPYYVYADNERERTKWMNALRKLTALADEPEIEKKRCPNYEEEKAEPKPVPVVAATPNPLGVPMGGMGLRKTVGMLAMEDSSDDDDTVLPTKPPAEEEKVSSHPGDEEKVEHPVEAEEKPRRKSSADSLELDTRGIAAFDEPAEMSTRKGSTRTSMRTSERASKNDIYHFMERELDFTALFVPSAESPVRCRLYGSMAYNSAKKVILFLSDSGPLGLWRQDPSDQETTVNHKWAMVRYLSRAQEEGYGIILCNPFSNTAVVYEAGGFERVVPVPESSTPRDHVLFVWKNFAANCKGQVSVIAFARGGALMKSILEAHEDTARQKIHRIAFIESKHEIDGNESPGVLELLGRRSMNWEASYEPQGGQIVDSQARVGCVCLSIGYMPPNTLEPESNPTTLEKAEDPAFAFVGANPEKPDQGECYAMKVLKKQHVISSGLVNTTMAERKILTEIRHPFVVRLHYAFQDASKLYLVMDYLSGGALAAHLRRRRKFPEDWARFYAAEVAAAMAHLHSLNIIYRDAKLENVLLDHEGHVRITDFGLSKVGVSDLKGAKTFCGTAAYIAPELLKGHSYGKAADWWSFGILLYEMIGGKPPYYHRNRDIMFQTILKQEWVRFPPEFSDSAISLIRGLLTRDPTQRLGSGPRGADEVLTHPFFDSISWPDLLEKRIQPPFNPGVGKLDTHYAPRLNNFEITARDRTGSVLGPNRPYNNDFDGFSFVGRPSSLSHDDLE